MFSPATREAHSTQSRKRIRMKLSSWGKRRQRLVLAFLLTILVVQVFPLVSYAQNLGAAPATGQAVQGQTAAQPEGTVLNLVNWVGNVIAPVGAALAVGMAGWAYLQGRGGRRLAVTGAGVLGVFGLTQS